MGIKARVMTEGYRLTTTQIAKSPAPGEGHDSIDSKEDRGLPNCPGRRFLGIVVSKGVKAENGRKKAAANRQT